jgi:hypothetical protein
MDCRKKKIKNIKKSLYCSNPTFKMASNVNNCFLLLKIYFFKILLRNHMTIWNKKLKNLSDILGKNVILT